MTLFKHSALRNFMLASITLALFVPSIASATGPRVTTSLFASDKEEIHTLDFPPFISNEVIDGGVFSAIVTHALSLAKIDATITSHPVKRIVKYYLKQENALAIIGRHLDLSEKEKESLISIPIAAIPEQYYYYKPSHPNGLNWTKSLSELKGLTYGSHPDEDVSLYKQAGINVVFGKTISLLKKLKNGTVDFIAIPPPNKEWLLDRYLNDDKDNFVKLGEHRYNEALYIVFNRKHKNGEDYAARFKDALATMIKDGSYQKIIEKHLGNGGIGKRYLRRLETFKD
jgi:polar amino acid transport system substrate-binding protein